MKIPPLLARTLLGGLFFSACGTGTVEPQPQNDAGIKDGAVVTPAGGFSYLAIIDVERQEKGSDFSCSSSSGPGSDIDAVALIRKGEIIGYGLVGSSIYSNQSDRRCKDGDCPDGTCKYADPASAAEGPPDAVINKGSDDKGYLSLNAGTLQMRIGDKQGKEPAQNIRSGDQIKVFEVDLTKKTDACTCEPERYQLVLQDGDKNLALVPSQFDKANASVCGSAPNADTRFGCGTSVFDVP